MTERSMMIRAYSNPWAWRPANNGSGKRMYFLMRDESVPIKHRYLEDGNGNLIRYARYETALKAADKLNREAGY